MRAWVICLLFFAIPARADESSSFGFRRLAVGASGATFSPDGARLAVGRLPPGKGIDLVPLTGGERTPLVDRGKEPAWSPDGRFIAYTGPAAEGLDDETVWVVEPTGKNARRLVKGCHPVWSADGKRLYYNTRPDWHVFSVAVDDRQPRPILLYGRGPARRPSLSPPGDRVVYSEEGRLQIITPLLDESRVLLAPGRAGLDPAWSPNGGSIAFAGDDRRPGISLFVFEGGVHEVAVGPFQAPAWSRDGRLLAFDFHLGEARDVFVTDQVGRHLGPVTQLETPREWTAVSSTLPELERADLDHRVWSLEQADGHLLFINIWASWCAPCRRELPLVQALYERVHGRTDLAVLTLNIDDDPKKARRYADAMGLTVPVVLGADYVRKLGRGNMVPRNWIVGPGRKLLVERVGFSTKERNNWIEEVLKEIETLHSQPQPPK